MTLLRESVGHFGRQLAMLRVLRAVETAPTICSCHRSHRVKVRQVTGHVVRLRASSNCGDIPLQTSVVLHTRGNVPGVASAIMGSRTVRTCRGGQSAAKLLSRFRGDTENVHRLSGLAVSLCMAGSRYSRVTLQRDGHCTCCVLFG
jgi:hypothetical protein